MTNSMIRNIRNGKKARRYGFRPLKSLPAFDRNGHYIAIENRRTYAMWLYI